MLVHMLVRQVYVSLSLVSREKRISLLAEVSVAKTHVLVHVLVRHDFDDEVIWVRHCRPAAGSKVLPQRCIREILQIIPRRSSRTPI